MTPGRIVKSFSDVTVGTVIVLFHVALADREQTNRRRARDDRDDHRREKRVTSRFS